MTELRAQATADGQLNDSLLAKMIPRSLAALTGIFAGGNALSTGLRMAGAILTAKFCEPSSLGLFNAIGLVLGYAPFLQLGILNGLSRELPFYVGKGDHGRVRELASAAQAWAITVGGFVALIMFGVALWEAFRGHWRVSAGWGANACAAFALFYGQYYLQFLYRTHGDFAKLALFSVAQSALSLLLVSAVWLFGYYGLCLRIAVANFFLLGLLWCWRPLRVPTKWAREHLTHLLKIGAPIFGVGMLYSWWIVLDSTLVLKEMGITALGLYSLVGMTTQAMTLLSQAVSSITYPQMAEQFGRTGKYRDCVRIAIKPCLYLLAGMIPLATAAWWIAPPVILHFLPKYRDAIPAVQWTAVCSIALCLDPLNNAFNIVKRQDIYAIAIGAGMLSYFICLKYLLSRGPSLTAFPVAMLCGHVVFMSISDLFLLHLWRKESCA